MPKKRRNYLVDKKFQLDFAVKFGVIVLVSSLLIAGLLMAVFENSTTVAIENARVNVKSTADFMFPLLVQTLVVATIFASLAVVITSVFLSHKVAGPALRFQKESEAVQTGDLTRSFNIRSRDQLQALARSLNDMTSVLREKHRELKRQSEDLRRFLEGKDDSLSPGDRRKAKAMIDDIEYTLKFFKVT